MHKFKELFESKNKWKIVKSTKAGINKTSKILVWSDGTDSVEIARTSEDEFTAVRTLSPTDAARAPSLAARARYA